jgi:hypothetical protein
VQMRMVTGAESVSRTATWPGRMFTSVLPVKSSHTANEEDGLVLRRYWTNAYQSCAIKLDCTTVRVEMRQRSGKFPEVQ